MLLLENNIYSACTSILIGKKASVDGSVMIGRNEDSKSAWPKHFIVHPQHTNKNEETVFKSNDSKFKLALPEMALKYTATPEWTTKFGLFEEDGFNEAGVAMSATESTYSNDRVLACDPLVKDGIGEEAMITVVLPYVKTAREGVSRLGQIIEAYGTCESNGILFGDKNEAWYMETAAGHQWVAQRIPDDSYAVVANQMAIEKIDFDNPDDFMWAPHIQEFVASNHLSSSRTEFNFRNIFGTNNLMDSYYNLPRVWEGQRLLSPEKNQAEITRLPFIQTSNQLLSVQSAQMVLSSHYAGTKYDLLEPSTKEFHHFRPISLAATQESHILQLRQMDDPAIADIHWLAMGVAAESSYVPFYAGINDTHPDYKRGEATYSPDSAYWVFKHAGVLVDSHPKEFLDELEKLQSELRIAFDQSIIETDKGGSTLSGIELSDYLTKQGIKNADLALTKYRGLTADLITKMTDLSPLKFQQDLML